MTNSSSSEDEAERSTSTAVRRRRLRKNTASTVTEPEEEEALETGPCEEEEEVIEVTQQDAQAEVRPAALEARGLSQGSNLLNKCILLALIIAFSMGFGHFYGKKFVTSYVRLLMFKLEMHQLQFSWPNVIFIF